MAYTILQVPGDGEVISSSFLTRIRDNQEFLKNVPGVGAEFQRFTSSGTWTKPADINWVYAMVIGAGAGGHGNNGTTQVIGGMPGFVSYGLFRAQDLSASVSVTVGSGTVGGTLNDAGHSAFGDIAAAGGRYISQWFAANPTNVHTFFGRPGQGGGKHAVNQVVALGVPGIGGSVFTPGGVNGADSDIGTGSGGGGSNTFNVASGHGGTPGGGGGAGRYDSPPGNGGGGEVRVYAW